MRTDCTLIIALVEKNYIINQFSSKFNFQLKVDKTHYNRSDLIRVCMIIFSIRSHVLVKREQELNEIWWELTSNGLCESFFNCHFLVKQEQELFRVDSVEKREFVWEFSQLSCRGQTRTRAAWELMRVEKQEIVWEFS